MAAVRYLSSAIGSFMITENYWRQTRESYSDRETINAPKNFQNILSMLTITHMTTDHNCDVVSIKFNVAQHLFKYERAGLLNFIVINLEFFLS
jgi:uncharacterized membrane protein